MKLFKNWRQRILEEKQRKLMLLEWEKRAEVIELHKYFNSKSFRIELPKEELEELLFKELNKTEQYINLYQELDFNSIDCYSSIIPIKRGEVGHDLNFRYVLNIKKI